MNSVNIIGRLTRDPELRHTPSGVAVCSMRIAVSAAGPPDAEGKPGGGFFDVTVWREQAEACAQYLEKGQEVGVSGSLKWREWEADDGTKRSAVEIVAFRVDFGRKAGEGGGTGGRQYGDDEVPGGNRSEDAYVPAGSADDDIPF